MSEIRIIDLPECTNIGDDDYLLLEQNDGTKKIKGSIINEKLIDLENRMTENIAKQYLEVSTDTGHMKVENCYNGRTKDLSIKGRTLQNLFKSNSNTYCNSAQAKSFDYNLIAASKTYTVIVNIKESNITQRAIPFMRFTMNTPLTYIYALKNGESGFIPTAGTHIFTLTIPADFVIGQSWIFYNNAYTSGDKVVADVMILEGDYTVNPPAHFEGIKSLGEEENKISILSQGKNLFKIDKNISSQKGIDYTSDNEIKIDLGNEGFSIFSVPIIVKKRTTLSLSMNKDMIINNIGVVIVNEDFTTYKSFNNSVTIDKDGIFRLKIARTEANATKGVISKIQIEEGATATSYELYKEDKKDILLPFKDGLKSLPHGVYEQYESDGKISELIIKKVYNGTEDWVLEPSGGGGLLSYFVLNDASLKPSASDKVITTISDTMPSITALEAWNGTNLGISITVSDNGGARITRPLGTTLEQLKSGLAANPLTLYAELKSPIIHNVTSMSLNTYKDITHVSCLNSIMPNNLGAKFPVSLSDTISRLTNENKSLEKENVELKNEMTNLAEELPNMISKEIRSFYLTKDIK